MNYENLTNCLNNFHQKYNVPGLDCIVCRNHEIIFRHTSGYNDIETEKKLKGDELYLIFSMTKMLTCTAALQLYEKGKFNLNDPVSMYLPEFEKMKITADELNSSNTDKITSGKSVGETVNNQSDGYAKNPITIRHLFTMTAGLNYDLKAPGIKKALDDGKTSTRDLVGALAETVLSFEPGTRYRYSLCHDVLGALIEIWSGKKLGEYMQENIFAPLGMKNTFFDAPKDEEQIAKMASRYSLIDGKLVKQPLECVFNLSPDYESGGAGLTSCTEDYALFLDAMACGGIGKSGNRILSSRTVELMRTNHLSGQPLEDFNNARNGYGYGLGVRTHIDKARSGSLSPIGEFGWDGAAGCFAMVDCENKISMTYFQHSHRWDIRMQTEMRNALYSCLDNE